MTNERTTKMKCQTLAAVAFCVQAFCLDAHGNIRNRNYPIAEEIRGDVDARLSRSDACKGLCRYVDYAANGGRGVFVENPDFWARGIDFSCASPWNSQDGGQRAGTAVSARHIVFAHHFPLQVGAHITFVGNDGRTVKRRLDNAKRVGGSDLAVGLLDEDLPKTVKPAYVLPNDFTNYVGYANDFPVVVFDQEEKALVREIPSVYRGTHGVQSLRKPKGELRRRFYEDIVGGDCGDPAFLVARGGVIFLATIDSVTGASPSVFMLRKEIQRAMDDLMSGYRLEEYPFAENYLGTNAR